MSKMWSVLLLAICSSLNGDFRPSDCKIVCPKNEEYSELAKTCNTCDHLLGNVPCNEDECRDSGCQCKSGFYRNSKGKCVTKHQCFETSEPELCGCDRGEVYLKCGCEKNCQNKFVPKSCVYECVSGCFCKKPLVRDSTGKCVKLESCTAGNGQSSESSEYDESRGHHSTKSSSWSLEYDEEDEEHDRSSRRSSQWSSTHRRGHGKSPKKSSSWSSEYNEDEEESYQSSRESSHWSSKHEKDSYEESDGSSTWSSHKGKKCGKNEIIVECAKPKWCNTCEIKGNCKLSAESCKKGCDCKKGYYRDSSGKCIPESKCSTDIPPVMCSPPKCDKAGCKLNYNTKPCPSCECKGKPPVRCNIPKCGLDCKIDYTTKPCPSCKCKGKSPVRCNMPKCGLDCKIDYTTKPCPSCKCKDTDKCPPNEKYSDCVVPCNGCEIRGKCNFLVCNKGCDCIEGYYRDENGKCIPETLCPPNTDVPPVTCDPPKCDGPGCKLNYDAKPCPSCECVSCSIPKCDKPGCKIDYKTKPCPSCKCKDIDNPPNTCGKDEVYNECGSACPPTCSNLGKIEACTLQCVQGCFCREGLVRNSKNKCVVPEKCPKGVPPLTCALPKCDGPGCRINYDTKPCPSCECVSCSIPECEAPNCEIDYKTKPCPSCKCRNSSPPDEKCGKNEEYYKCKPTCRNTCENYSAKVPLCPRICNKGCACKKGLVKRKDGKCVKPNQCGDTPDNPPSTCSKNEVYKECGSACVPTCSNLGKNDEVCTEQCVQGCFCRDGFVRNSKNKCVRPEKCPKDLPPVTCDPPKCGEPGCRINYNTKPCPSCECVSCSIPMCEAPGCEIDYKTKPCPSCKCKNSTPPDEKCGKNEEYYNCKPTCKNTCENYSAKVPLCPRICNKGCACEKGLVKRKDGKCVKPNQCGDTPEVPPNENCGKGEEYYECIPTCKNTCENYKAKKPICPLICIKGCACKKGLVKRKDGKCVKPQKCDNTPDLPPIECDPPKCDGPGCRINYNTKPCPSCECVSCSSIPKCDSPGCKIDYTTKPCPSCECKNTGTPPGEKCKKGEEFYNCRPTCKNTCEIYKAKNPICPRVCIKGCACKKGLVKRKDGKCVRPDKCENIPETPPEENCGKGEEYYGCIPTCKNTCENYRAKNPICPRICIKGCACKKGLVKRKDGKCVRPEKCENTPETPPEENCGKGEEYYECIPTCKNTCENYKAKKPICPLICIKGCACKKGLVKRKDGKCVKPQKCDNSPDNNPSTCDKNEVYKECGSACPPTCSNLGKSNEICTKQCVKGCFCRDGFVRNSKNKCVRPEKCPKVIPPGEKCGKGEEYYECIPTCKNTCENYKAKKPICPLICIKGCACKKGLVKRKDGRCVRPHKCDNTPNNPPSTCDSDEVYEECGSACPPTCSNLGKAVACTKQCVQGCFCRKGLVRNSKHKCVRLEECSEGVPPVTCDPPKCDGPGCRINYDTKPCPSCECVSCSIPMCDGPGCKIDYNTKPCPSCTCKNTGTPPNENCGKGEEYHECIPTCRNTCENYKAKKPICPLICIKGCACKKGLIKRKDGKCVRPEKCGNTPNNPPNTCGKNEVYEECGSACPPTCSNLGKAVACTKQCVQGCFCLKGLVRNSKHKCVRPEECSKGIPPVTCDPPKCDGPGCRINYNTKPCPSCECVSCSIPKCDSPGCKIDYTTKPCPSCKCKKAERCPPNEYYSDCAIPCNDCQTRGKCNFLVCNKGCDCIKGYYRDENRRCIPENLCPAKSPTQCGQDEQYYQCIPSCSRTCERVLSKVKIFCNQLCKPGCFCKEGLVLSNDGKCVKPSDCTAITTPQDNCGIDEVYNECGSACPPSCSTLGKNQVCTLQCVQGCFCRNGLVRNDRNECVHPDQCPKSLPIEECQKGEEYYDCKPTCRNTCENYRAVNPICPRICIRGCACKAGLVKREDGKCVKPERCNSTPGNPPQSCGVNEVYNECGSACPATCSNLGKSEVCTLQCVQGCFCREGFVRNSLNECVRPEMCPKVPPVHVCGLNEEYYDCVPNCKNTCETYNQENTVCPLYCREGCGCKKGFVKRKDGKCVRPDQCDNTHANCGLKKKYYECMPSCTNVCNPPDVCAAVCRSGCFCREDLVLREDGHCVKREFCDRIGQPSCDINEQYYDCIPDCGNTCKTYGKKDIACPAICRPGCFCKPGLVLNDENKCVLPEFCPRPVTECKNPDQQYYDCIPECTNTCDNYGKIIACPKLCKPGCFCKPGLVMNNENVCVRPKECPKSGFCEDRNMQYYECTPSCKNNCKNYFNPGIRCGCGPPGCFCRQGLVKRESDGRCVLPEQCHIVIQNGGQTSSSEISSGSTSTQISETYNDESFSGRTSSSSSSSQIAGYDDQYAFGTASSQSSSSRGSQSSQSSSQSISELSGYQSDSQSSQTSGQIISESSGYQTGNQVSQTSDQVISESSGYQIGSQSSQTSGQIISEASGYQRGNKYQNEQLDSSIWSSGYQDDSLSQNSQVLSQSSAYQDGSFIQNSQSSSQSSSLSSAQQEGSYSQNSQVSSQSSPLSSGQQDDSNYQNTQASSGSSGSSFVYQDESSSGIFQSASDSSSASSSAVYQSGNVIESSQTENGNTILSSGYQDETSNQFAQFQSQDSFTAEQNYQNTQTGNDFQSWSTGYQEGGFSQDEQAQSEFSSYTSAFEGDNSQNVQSSTSLRTSASENQNEFSKTGYSSSFQDGNDQSSQPSSSSSWMSESSSDSELSNQSSSWFSTVKDENDSPNEEFENSYASSSSSSSTSSGYQNSHNFEDDQSSSQSSSWSTGYTDGNKAQNGDSNGGFSSWSSGHQEENGARTAEWDDSHSSWSSDTKNEARM